MTAGGANMDMVTSDAVTMHCPECNGVRTFERPHGAAGCPDRAGDPGGCPELACIDCGTAFVAGFAIPPTVTGSQVIARQAGRPGRAA